MTEERASGQEAPKPATPVRRRASRAAGPAGGTVNGSSAGVRVEAPTTVKVRVPRPAGPPPRRPPNRRLVAIVALATGFVAAAALAAVVSVLLVAQRHAEASQARDQRFVDTATQTVVNMFSYTQDNIDDSVNRFVNGTSGPLRDMLSQDNNVENLKAIFRDTNASSEAVINGAALEKCRRDRRKRVGAGVGSGHRDRHRRRQQAVPAVPASGHRARGRQRPHDRLRPQVPRGR